MAIVTLHPAASSSSFSRGGSDPPPNTNIVFSVVGTADPIDAVTTLGDGKYVQFENTTANDIDPFCAFSILFDASPIPLGSTLNSLQFVINHEKLHGVLATSVQPAIWPTQTALPATGTNWPDDNPPTGAFAHFDAPNTSDILSVGGFTTWTATSIVGNVNTGYNIFTSLPWVRADLNNTWFGVQSAITGESGPVTCDYNIDYIAMVVDYTLTTPSVWYYNPLTNHYQYATSPPGSPWQPGTPTMTETTVNPVFGSTAGGN